LFFYADSFLITDLGFSRTLTTMAFPAAFRPAMSIAPAYATARFVLAFALAFVVAVVRIVVLIAPSGADRKQVVA